jgi:hypothetical protein
MAKNVYGVVIDPKSFEVDYKATTELREKMKAQKKGGGEKAIKK